MTLQPLYSLLFIYVYISVMFDHGCPSKWYRNTASQMKFLFTLHVGLFPGRVVVIAQRQIEAEVSDHSFYFVFLDYSLFQTSF